MAEVYDAFTYQELMWLEAMGLCEDGEAGKLLEKGDFNLDGTAAGQSFRRSSVRTSGDCRGADTNGRGRQTNSGRGRRPIRSAGAKRLWRKGSTASAASPTVCGFWIRTNRRKIMGKKSSHSRNRPDTSQEPRPDVNGQELIKEAVLRPWPMPDSRFRISTPW